MGIFILMRVNNDDGAFVPIIIDTPPPPPPPLTATTTTFRCMVDDSDVVRNDSTISSRYRSCQFHNLSVTTRNTDTNKYIVFPSPEEVALQELLQTLPNQELVTISSIRSPMILS